MRVAVLVNSKHPLEACWRADRETAQGAASRVEGAEVRDRRGGERGCPAGASRRLTVGGPGGGNVLPGESWWLPRAASDVVDRRVAVFEIRRNLLLEGHIERQRQDVVLGEPDTDKGRTYRVLFLGGTRGPSLRLLDPMYRQGRALADLGGDLLTFAHELFDRHDMIDESQSQRLVGTDAIAGVEHLQRAAERDEAR